ncbi:MAG: methyltransferase [Bacteroidetes bacterium]|nr:methyltransferase [Bacteroidota bacterium]MBU1718415.1 methyltransferase [Bacteroidota bacterium]
MSDFFRFQQFLVFHKNTPMKVGTDGVLLGAWAPLPENGKVLDIGTGCGLIALMIAQRCNLDIDAVEIHDGACLEAQSNFSDSPWAGRIRLFNDSVQNFAFGRIASYNLIVCNPPFYVNSLKPDTEGRTTARHAISLKHEELAKITSSLLKPGGKAALILPADAASQFITTCKQSGLMLNQLVHVKPTPEKPAKRALMLLGQKEVDEVVENEMVVEVGRHRYSDEYARLTRDFYLP